MGFPLSLCPRQCLLSLLPILEEERYLTVFFTGNPFHSQNADSLTLAQSHPPYYPTMEEGGERHSPIQKSLVPTLWMPRQV